MRDIVFSVKNNRSHLQCGSQIFHHAARRQYKACARTAGTILVLKTYGALIEMAKKSTAAAKKSPAKPSLQSPNPNRVFQGGMPTTLGMKLVSVTKKKVVVEMPVKDQHRNWNGRVNGWRNKSFRMSKRCWSWMPQSVCVRRVIVKLF